MAKSTVPFELALSTMSRKFSGNGCKDGRRLSFIEFESDPRKKRAAACTHPRRAAFDAQFEQLMRSRHRPLRQLRIIDKAEHGVVRDVRVRVDAYVLQR